MMVPTITRTTEEMLMTVPHAIREAALGSACRSADGGVGEFAHGVAGNYYGVYAGVCARGWRDGAAAVYGVCNHSGASS